MFNPIAGSAANIRPIQFSMIMASSGCTLAELVANGRFACLATARVAGCSVSSQRIRTTRRWWIVEWLTAEIGLNGMNTDWMVTESSDLQSENSIQSRQSLQINKSVRR